MDKKFFLGIDGGGTYTRAAIADENGILISDIKLQGGTCKYKNANPKENVYNAINEAIKKANVKLENISSLVAGVAGYDGESDEKWVQELTNIDGLNCPMQSVNDSVIAQKGSFLSTAGIIIISGTGSKIFGISESDVHFDNYDFYHYARTAARFLSYDCIHKIIAGEVNETDTNLIDSFLRSFSVNNLSELIKLGSAGFIKDDRERDKLFGGLAPIVTDAAISGSHLARLICNKAADDLATGVKLIGACFESETIPVALIGSVAKSTYMKNKIKENLQKENNNREYHLVKPTLPPQYGAIIMAMQLANIDLSNTIINNLQKGGKL